MITASLKDIIYICHADAGFSLSQGRCGRDLTVKIYRSGCPWEEGLSYDLTPACDENGIVSFVLPKAFWDAPAGHYNVDVYSCGQFVKTIRMVFQHEPTIGQPTTLENTSACAYRPCPNVEPVVECCPDEPVCEEEECEGTQTLCCDTDEPKDSAHDIREHINNAQVHTGNQLLQYIEELCELFDQTQERGWYYHKSIPVGDDVLAKMQELKERLSDLENTTPEEAVDEVVILQAQLRSLVSDVSRQNKVAKKIEAVPQVEPLAPKKHKKRPRTQLEKIAAEMEAEDQKHGN